VRTYTLATRQQVSGRSTLQSIQECCRPIRRQSARRRGSKTCQPLLTFSWPKAAECLRPLVDQRRSVGGWSLARVADYVADVNGDGKADLIDLFNGSLNTPPTRRSRFPWRHFVFRRVEQFGGAVDTQFPIRAARGSLYRDKRNPEHVWRRQRDEVGSGPDQQHGERIRRATDALQRDRFNAAPTTARSAGTAFSAMPYRRITTYRGQLRDV